DRRGVRPILTLLVVVVLAVARVAQPRRHLRHDRPEDPGVAALVEAGDRPFPREPEPGPRRHLVALDQGEDLLDPLALGGREDEVALRWCGSGAKVDDAKRPVLSVDKETERDGVVPEKELIDTAARRRRP